MFKVLQHFAVGSVYALVVNVLKIGLRGIRRGMAKCTRYK